MEIKGFENYLVYEDGRVMNSNTNLPMKPSLIKGGYFHISLCRNGKETKFMLHRLLATAYIPNPNNLPEVDHIDIDTSNNNLSNLRWVSKKDNANNKNIAKNNKSGYQGVCYRKNRNKWVAYYKLNGKQKQKEFKTIEGAIAFRKEMVDKYYNRPNLNIK